MTKIVILQHLNNHFCVHFQLKDNLYWYVSHPRSAGEQAGDADLLLLWFLCLERFLKQGSDFNWENTERLEMCGELLGYFRAAKGAKPNNTDYLSVKAAQNWDETSKKFNPEAGSLLKVPQLPKTPLHSLSTEKLKELFSYLQLNSSRYTVNHLRTNFDDFWSDFETSDQKEKLLEQYFPIQPNLQQSCLLPFSQTPELYSKMKSRPFFEILMQQLAKPILFHLEALLSKNEPDRIITVVRTLLILAFHSSANQKTRNSILSNIQKKLIHCSLYPLVYDKLHHYFKNLKDDMDSISQYSPLGLDDKESHWDAFSLAVKENIDPSKWKKHTIDPEEVSLSKSNKNIEFIYIDSYSEIEYDFYPDLTSKKWIRISKFKAIGLFEVVAGKETNCYQFSYIRDPVDPENLHGSQIVLPSHPEFGTILGDLIYTDTRLYIKFTFPRKLESGERIKLIYTQRTKSTVDLLEDNIENPKPLIRSQMINEEYAITSTYVSIYPEWYPLQLITVQNGEFSPRNKPFFALRPKDQPKDEDGNIINKYYSTNEHAEHVAQHSILHTWIEDGKRKVELKIWADKKTGFIRPGLYGIAHARVTKDELNKAYAEWLAKQY